MVLALPGSITIARAQEGSPPPGEQRKMRRQAEFDDAEVERLFREYQRLTRALERRQVQPAPVRPRTNWDDRPRGDFWTPGDRQRLFGR
jgi:hypothetical protein